MDERAVAWGAGAVVIPCSHYNSVRLSTVQIVPGAGGVVGEALVGVAIEPSCYSNICFSPVTWTPANRARVKLTLYIVCDIAGDTWGWGREKGEESNIHMERKRKCVTEMCIVV